MKVMSTIWDHGDFATTTSAPGKKQTAESDYLNLKVSSPKMLLKILYSVLTHMNVIWEQALFENASDKPFALWQYI